MGVDFLLLRSMYAIKADLRLLVFFGVIVQLLGCATDLEEKKVSNSQSTAQLSKHFDRRVEHQYPHV